MGWDTCVRSDVKAGEKEPIVTEVDLEHFLHLLEGKDGVMDWQSLMERSTPNMTYQAWRHEPEVGFICSIYFLHMIGCHTFPVLMGSNSICF